MCNRFFLAAKKGEELEIQASHSPKKKEESLDLALGLERYRKECVRACVAQMCGNSRRHFRHSRIKFRWARLWLYTKTEGRTDADPHIFVVSLGIRFGFLSLASKERLS